MAGTKTSVWLGEDLHRRWKASRLSLTEIVGHGLDAIEQEQADAPDLAAMAGDVRAIREELDARPDDDRVRRIVRDELEKVSRQ